MQFVECDPFCSLILRQHWPTVPIHNDVHTFRPPPGSANVICAGFPCQDLSIAGKQAGIQKGNRSGLFFELMRVICIVRPTYVVLENVSAILGNGLDTVLGRLAQAGYNVEWSCIRASDIGAKHKRDRWWAVAYANSNRRKGDLLEKIPWQQALQRVESCRGFKDLRDGPAFGTPRLLRGNDGLPNKLDRLRAIGNAVVPQVVMIPLARVLELQGQFGP